MSTFHACKDSMEFLEVVFLWLKALPVTNFHLLLHKVIFPMMRHVFHRGTGNKTPPVVWEWCFFVSYSVKKRVHIYMYTQTCIYACMCMYTHMINFLQFQLNKSTYKSLVSLRFHEFVWDALSFMRGDRIKNPMILNHAAALYFRNLFHSWQS